MKIKSILFLTLMFLFAIPTYSLDYLVNQYKKEIKKIDLLPLKKIITNNNEVHYDLKSDDYNTNDNVHCLYFDSKMNIRKYISESKLHRIVCYYNDKGDLFYISGKVSSINEKDEEKTESWEAGEIYIDMIKNEAICLDMVACISENNSRRLIRSSCLSCNIPKTMETVEIDSIATTNALMRNRSIPFSNFDMNPDVKFDADIEGKTITIVDNRAELRTRTDNNCKVLKTLTAGDKVEVIERQKKSKKEKYHWYKIIYRYDNNQRTEAYIYGEYLDSMERTI